MSITLYTAATTLILVMDPVGNVPVFLAILKHFDPVRRRHIICREVIAAFIILALFLFFGRYVMDWLHLSTEAMGIAGGIILFLIALRMIFPPDKKEAMDVEEEPFIVPLAIPLIAGPSTLTTVVLFATNQPEKIWTVFIAIIIATIIFLAVMLSSGYLMHVLGKRVLTALERLMGMLLTMIAVQMFLTGITHALH